MIELRDFGYSYPGSAADASHDVPVLRDIDLRVDEGELVVVAGPSGCGKTSLLRALCGLVPHFHGGTVRGRVRVAGRDPIELGPRGMSEHVGFVHQNPEAHFVTRVVEDELAFAMENHGFERVTMRRRVEEVLDQLAIAELRGRDIETLSGGERQRVAIASVLTLQPAVLVLDEPTSQLDPQSASEVLAALRTLNADLGLTLIVAEHRLERIADAADRVLLLEAGRIAALGPPAEALDGSPLAPPLVQLGHALGWRPPSLTLEQTRRRPEFRRLRERVDETRHPESGAAAAPPGPADAPPAIEARDLWWTYPGGALSLRGLDLAVPRGSLTALLGRNGAGKSTLLRSLVGLIRPQRGGVRLRPDSERTVDPQATPLDEVAQDVGFVPQNPSRLLFKESVDAELAWSLEQRGDVETARRELHQWLELLGLDSLGPRHPRETSTGERQRIALATAFAGGPSILLLDEPTRGLDAEIKYRLAEGLHRLCRRGVTVLMATHDVEMVAACADRAVLLGGGQVVAAGPIRQMLHGSPVFSTRIHRLFGDPRVHTVEDVLRLVGEREEKPIDEGTP